MVAIVEKICESIQAHSLYLTEYSNAVNLIKSPYYSMICSQIEDDWFNYIVASNFTGHQAKRVIDEIESKIQEIKSFSWWVSPIDEQRQLSTVLHQYGYKHKKTNTLMYCDLNTWNNRFNYPKELEIVKITHKDSFMDFSKVYPKKQQCFNKYFSRIIDDHISNSAIEYYVGYTNNQPVVRAATFYHTEVAALHWLYTHPKCRRKQYAYAMQHYRMSQAKQRGYSIAGMHCSKLGTSLSMKSGFKSCANYYEYKKS